MTLKGVTERHRATNRCLRALALRYRFVATHAIAN